MTATLTSTRRYATVTDAAAYCGLAPVTVRRMIARRELDAYRPVPGRVLIDLRALDALIRASARRRGTRGRHLHADAEREGVSDED